MTLVGRQQIVSNLLMRYVTIPTSLHILEIDCGTGGHPSMLSHFDHTSVVKPAEGARRYAYLKERFEINSKVKSW